MYDEIKLTPGNFGNDCLGNGMCGEFECLCDECDYLLCCTEILGPDYCEVCEEDCPHAGTKSNISKYFK